MKMQKFPKFPILLVDDEEDILQSYKMSLRLNKINNFILCEDSRNVMDILKETRISAIILDLFMPNITGQELLGQIKSQNPYIPIIVVTGSNKVTTAVECMKKGAMDYMVKPVEECRLISGITNALNMGELQWENRALKKRILSSKLKNPDAFSNIITISDSMKSIFNYIEAVAGSNMPILITGDSGVGKEVFARAIHKASGRQGEFVPVNVAGLEDTVFSDTLFGHKKGAFTGADADRQGLIEKASGGTIFLDEIGTLDIGSQVKLLRLLQEKEYYSLGSDIQKISNAVIIAATNEDLKSRMKGGEFRHDLYFRLKIHHIYIPPLRKRPEDVPFLVNHFLKQACEAQSREVPEIPEEACALLRRYSFPGNVRELQSIVFDVVSRSPGNILDVQIISEHIQEQFNEENAQIEKQDPVESFISYCGKFPSLKEIEDYFISEAMRKSNGSQSVAAQLLGVSQSTISRRYKKEFEKSPS